MKLLEEQTKKRTVESVVFVKKSQQISSTVTTDVNDTSSCDENSDHGSSDHQEPQSLPEMEMKVSEKDVLIRIHCEKQKGAMVKILNLLEKLQLTVLNSSVLQFGNSTLDITIIAQVYINLCPLINIILNYHIKKRKNQTPEIYWDFSECFWETFIENVVTCAS